MAPPRPSLFRSRDHSILVLSVVALVMMVAMPSDGQVGNCDEKCSLPSCYCQYDTWPVERPPQMVQFTYTGPVSDEIRSLIQDTFPSSYKNPNGHSIAITIFVVGTNSKACAVHMLYARGHEIALAGMNIADLGSGIDWNATIPEQRDYLSKNASIPISHIVGMRAQDHAPGGDAQFQELRLNGLKYDSSLRAGPSDSSTASDAMYPWPFTLDRNFSSLGFECQQSDPDQCPSNTYPGLWEIPETWMMGEGDMLCEHLDNCIQGKDSSQIADFLVRQFQTRRKGSRVPLQINLSGQSLESKRTRDGLRAYLDHLMDYEDVWIVTSRATLAWMADPSDWKHVGDSGVFDAEKRSYGMMCESVLNETSQSVSLRDVMDTETIWIWQTVILILLYIFIVRYDRMKREEKKR